MYIKLNILQDQVCAQIYAYAENEEEWFELNGFKTYQVKIWHNADSHSLTIPKSELKNYNNDLFVNFHSNIRFKDFCKTFAESEYNDPNRYHYLKHNCADAANFALRLADIKLPIRYIKMTSPAPDVLLRIPTPVLTPFDLFQFARQHKMKRLESSNINFKLELAFSAFGFWARSTENPRVKKKSETVILELEKSIKSRSHLAEQYLEAIIESTNRLLSKDPIYSKEYSNFVERFREREAFPFSQAISQNLNILIVTFFLANMFLLVGFEEKKVSNIVFTLVLIGTMGPMIKAYIDSRSYFHRNTHETSLSRTLHDFSNTVSSELDTTENDEIEGPNLI